MVVLGIFFGVLLLLLVVFIFVKKQNKNYGTTTIDEINTTAHLRRIAITARKLSNQVFAGSYHSAFKGRGISFSEVREYQYGDDVRAIDWNVTARANKPFVKVFEEERELTLMLLIDVSRSTLFGTQQFSKKELIAIISGILAYSATTNNDKVGVIFFSDKIEKFIPPKKGKTHIMRIIAEIDHFESKRHHTDIKFALQHFANYNKKKCIAFLISDFINPLNYEKELAILARKNDVIGIQIFDKREKELTPIGAAYVRDAETGEQLLADVENNKLIQAYKNNFIVNQKKVKDFFVKNGAQFTAISTADNFTKNLIQLFKERETKR